MAKDEIIEKFYNRFKDYSKPSKLQVEFLDYYKRKDTLTNLENKKLLATVRALENIDKLNYQNKVKRNLEKAEKAEKRKELTHLQIIAGAAFLKALSSNSREKLSYTTSFNNLVAENFIDKEDAKKLTDYLAKSSSDKSLDTQVLQQDLNSTSTESSINNTTFDGEHSNNFNQGIEQQSVLPFDNSNFMPE